MDTDKLMMEVEMKTLTLAEEDKDTKEDKMEKTKGQEKEQNDNLPEKEEEQEPVQRKPNNPSENVYMTVMTSSTPKQDKDVYRSNRLYKKILAVFIILSLLLLAVVLALAMMLYKVQFSQKCSDPSDKVENKQSYPSNNEYQCSICEKGWGKFKNSCYFMSKERLNWQQSREACLKKGGDLVVINDEQVQKFLTLHGDMLYWIGLRYSDEQQWMWVNNTAPIQSYWANGQPEPGSHSFCALLNRQPSNMKNWHSKPCMLVSHYICQKE